MSGYATGRRPRTDAEWAREIQARIAALESSRSIRVGDWVLNSRDGNLIATAPGNKVVLSDPVLAPVGEGASPISVENPSNLIGQIQDLTGLDLSSPQAFFASLVELLIGGDGPLGFVQSLIEKIKDIYNLDLSSPTALFDSIRDLFDGLVHTLQEIVAHFEEKTGLDIDAGPVAFIESLFTAVRPLFDGIVHTFDELVEWFEEKTDLNIDEGPVVFIQSLFTAVRPLFDGIVHTFEELVEWFETKTDLNIDAGPAAFLQSLFDKLLPKFDGLVHTFEELVEWFETKTDLNIDAGPAAFLQSLFDKLLPKFDGIVHTLDEIVAWFEIKTGLTISQGPVEFIRTLFNALRKNIEDLIKSIAATVTQVVTYIETQTGLNIDQGPVEFLRSLVEQIRTRNGVDLTSVTTVFTGIKTQIENLIRSIAATLQQMVDHLELKTGLEIDSGPVAFIQSLFTNLKPKLSTAAVPEGWQGFLDKVGGRTSATDQTLADRLQHLNATGLFNATRLNGSVPNTQVTGFTVTNALGTTTFPNLGDAAQRAHSNIQATWDEWMSALTGQSATTGTAPLTAGQIKELMATVVANATAIAQLQAETQASGGGMSGGDEFERPASATVDGWAVTTSDATGSAFALDGHEAYWVERGKATTVRYRRTDPKDALTKTAYQSITRVNGTRVLEYGIGGVEAAADLIFGRMSADGTRYIVAEVDNNEVKLRYNVGAGELDLKTEPLDFKPAAGTRLTLECGTSASINTYRVLRNGQVILTHVDSGGVTSTLQANRGWGWGGRSFKPLVGEFSPSSVNSVNVFDNMPITVVGTHLRAYRATSATVASPDGDQDLPDRALDAVDNPSQNLAWDVPTQTLTVTEPGPYNITMRLEFNGDINPVDRWELLLYVKKASQASFPSLTAPTLRGASQAGATGSRARSVAGSFSVYLEPGDQVRPGISTNVTPLVPDVQITGDAGGSRTWMVVTRGT